MIFIHVGLHKTGTTFLQREIFPKLQSDKIRIISNEALSGIPHQPVHHADGLGYFERYQLADYIHFRFPDARIIVGLREKKSWVFSCYCQYVKTGGFLCFDDWRRDVFYEKYLDFDGYVDYLRSCFPSVYVYYFEDLQRDVNSFVKGLCDFIGVDVPVFENRFYNVGWNTRQLWLGRFLNRYWRRFVLPRFLIERLNKKGVPSMGVI